MDTLDPAQKALSGASFDDSSFSGACCSLFAPPPIAGIRYRDDFITRLEEAHLLAIIDAQPWNTDIKRWTQYYGGRYRDGEGRAGRTGVLPEWALVFAQRLFDQGYFPERPNRM